MTNFIEHTALIEKARAGRRAALTSLHSRLGHTDKVVSIFDNAFPPRLAEPEFHSVRALTARRVLHASAHLAAA
ncbi:MAG: hypothetical protein R3D80_11800 [Paracoccaceae bacterium]|nr:hypothetical protein [Maritimibacter sp.]